MELPDLGEPREENFLAKLKKLRDLSYQGDLGPMGYELNRKGLKLNGNIDNAMAELMLKLNGDWNLQAQKPLWGGNLQFNASDGDGGRKYGLQFQKQF